MGDNESVDISFGERDAGNAPRPGHMATCDDYLREYATILEVRSDDRVVHSSFWLATKEVCESLLREFEHGQMLTCVPSSTTRPGVR